MGGILFHFLEFSSLGSLKQNGCTYSPHKEHSTLEATHPLVRIWESLFSRRYLTVCQPSFKQPSQRLCSMKGYNSVQLGCGPWICFQHCTCTPGGTGLQWITHPGWMRPLSPKGCGDRMLGDYRDAKACAVWETVSPLGRPVTWWLFSTPRTQNSSRMQTLLI